jgi:hypothetical protein
MADGDDDSWGCGTLAPLLAANFDVSREVRITCPVRGFPVKDDDASAGIGGSLRGEPGDPGGNPLDTDWS